MIPKEVIDAAKGPRSLGGTLVKICRYKGEDFYTYKYSEVMTIGFPEYYAWDGKRARVIYGVDALNLLSKLPI